LIARESKESEKSGSITYLVD